MGSSKQPFLYHAGFRDGRFPEPMFDPKAVTRASWEPKPRRPVKNGPLISLDHDFVDGAFSAGPAGHIPPGIASTRWIKAARTAQLVTRVLQLNGALCVAALSALPTNMGDIITWLLRIAPGVVIVHSAYSIYHLSRDVAARPPASSAAYQAFAAAVDIATVGAYVFAIISIKSTGSQWGIRLQGEGILEHIIPALLWTLVASTILHFVSCVASCWLAWQLRKIARIPPDLNPLKNNAASRTATVAREAARASTSTYHHKRSKSSVATTSIYSDDDGVSSPYSLSTPALEGFEKDGRLELSREDREEDEDAGQIRHGHKRPHRAGRHSAQSASNSTQAPYGTPRLLRCPPPGSPDSLSLPATRTGPRQGTNGEELKAATIGITPRNVSSGTDFESQKSRLTRPNSRHVSGKLAEEGLASAR